MSVDTVTRRPYLSVEGRTALIHAAAVGDRSSYQLAEQFGMNPSAVREILRYWRGEILRIRREILAGITESWKTTVEDRVDMLWEHYHEYQARLDELLNDARLATEAMRKIDPDAAPVLVNMREWRDLKRDQTRLIEIIGEQLGEVPAKMPVRIPTVSSPITDYEVLVADADGNLYPVQNGQ